MKASFEGLSHFNQLPCPLALIDESFAILWSNEMWNAEVESLRKASAESQTEIDEFIGKMTQSSHWMENFRACLKGESRLFRNEIGGISLTWKMNLADLPGENRRKKQVWVFFQQELEVMEGIGNPRLNLVQQAKLRELSEMAASIAHEVNNPLAVIYARASFLRERLLKNQLPNEVALEGLEKICMQSNRIVRIIRGLRNFSRDSSRDPFSLVPLATVVDDAAALVNEAIRNHGIDLKLQRMREDLVIECRPTQILQVIVNLLKNAIEAVAATKFPQVEISMRERSTNLVEICVKDNGPGVPQQLQAKIFHPFFTTKESGIGTGLGLSVSLKIIESHKGKLFLDSSKGPSCFVIQLPIKQMSSVKAI
jgi:signal transduction histidine kinase